MAGFTYKSYSFIDKDPIIDEIRTIYAASGTNYRWIADESGVSISTLVNWFGGKTKRPQAASINAVLRSLGYQLSITELRKPVKIDPPMPQHEVKPHASAVRHVVQMAKYKKGAR